MSLDFSGELSARQLPGKEQCFYSAAFRAALWHLIIDRKAIVSFIFLQPIDKPVSMLHNNPPQFHQLITMISHQDSWDLYKFYFSTKFMCGYPIISRSVYNPKSVIFTSWWWLSIILPGLGGLLNNLHFALNAPQSNRYFSDTKLGYIFHKKIPFELNQISSSEAHKNYVNFSTSLQSIK